MQFQNYTKAEKVAIGRAFDMLTYAASMSFHYSPRLAEAVTLERKQAYPGRPSPILWAQAIVIKRWFAGYSAPDTPARKIAGWRPGALGAFMLGVSMVHDHGEGDDPRAVAIRKVAELAPAAIEAFEAQAARDLAAI